MNSPNTQTRFSRRTLNMITFATIILIVLFYNLPGAKHPEDPTPEQHTTTLDDDQQAELFAESTQPTLAAPDIIKELPVASHRINIESWTTAQGATVLFVESREVPMLDVRLVFNAGSARDGAQHGLAMLTNAMLNEGTDTYSVDDIARGFESLGARFGNGSYRDMAIVSLRTLSDEARRSEALDLFYHLLAKSNFPTANVARIREQMLRSLEHDQQSPRALVSQAFYRSLYGDHPYAGDTGGESDTVAALSREDAVQFYRRYYVASNAVMTLVGDISRQQAEAIANELDQHLPAGQPASALPSPTPLPTGKQVLVDFPSQQSHILMGNLGVERGDPRWYALAIGNEILGGGGFTSRLNQIIRQDNGLAYSVYSNFSPMAVNGPFIMGLQTRNDQADKARQLMQQTLAEFIAEGPTDAEVEDAKQRILNRFPLAVANNAKIIDNLGVIGFYHLPLDYLDQYPARISAITKADIQSAFRSLLNADQLLTVILQPQAPTEPNSSTP